MSDDLYYEKYMKYKAKYMDLKYGGKKENYTIYSCKSVVEMNDVTKCTKVRDQLIPERIIRLIKETKLGNIVDKNIFVLEANLAEFEKGLKSPKSFMHRLGKGVKKTGEAVATGIKKGTELAVKGVVKAVDVASSNITSIIAGGDPVDALF